jgi:hypothetical protein
MRVIMPENEQNHSRATAEYSRVIPVWKFALFSIASMGFIRCTGITKTGNFLRKKITLMSLLSGERFLCLFFCLPY